LLSRLVARFCCPAAATALLAAQLAAAPLAADLPPVPDEAAIAALVAELLEAPLPAPEPEAGAVRLATAADERDLNRGFLDDLEALPDWQGVAIVLAGGTLALADVAHAVARPDLLACDAAACRLAAPLLVAPGATLVVADLTVTMVQSAGALVSAQGDLWISDAEILGWDESTDAPARTDAEGQGFRPWVAALEASRTVVRSSRLAHLGYDSNSTQGLAFTDADREDAAGRPSADIVGNRIEDLWFGFFTWNAEGIRVLRNTVEGSHVYGLDPHDATRDMLIAENFIEGTRDSHGIVMSRRIHDTVVTRNRSIGNGGAGYFLDKGSWNVTFALNEAFDNGTDGITVYESRNVAIRDNHVAGNGRAGIRVRASADIAITGNIVHDNDGPGIFVYDWSHAAREPDAEDEAHMQPVRVTITDNRLADNTSGDCSLQGAVELIDPAASDC
jgi:poly(beta-D-mannuronate) C5 epimerase